MKSNLNHSCYNYIKRIGGEKMNTNFYMPTKVFLGKNIVKEKGELLASIGQKAFIITGKHSSKKNGSLKDVEDVLKKYNKDYIIYDDIEENPSIETIIKAAKIGKENAVDFLIGVGGGSPIDASKAIGVAINNPHLTEETLLNSDKLESLPIVAVPTTSGTGTETTQYAIVTDHKDKTKKNLGQVVFPVVSLLDPSYTENMNEEITISTTVDALSHIVEGYLNKNASEITDALAIKALKLWGKAIPSLKSRKFTYEDRENFMLASSLAGMIIAQTGTSIPHGMGYHLTYFKGVPHGLANGCLYVEYLNSFKDKTRIYEIVEHLGLSSYEEFISLLSDLTKIDIEVSEEEIEEYASSMVSNKAKLKNHPEDITKEEIKSIYLKSLK